MRVLDTDDAGFIGQHLVKLLAQSDKAIVPDKLAPVVHGQHPDKNIPGYGVRIEESIELFDDCGDAVFGCDAVIHLAAGVSVEASFYQPSRFVRTNSLGTAVLWEAIRKAGTVKNVVVASSMSVYGHGKNYFGMTEF